MRKPDGVTGRGIPDQSHQPKEPTGRPAEKRKRGQDHGPNPLKSGASGETRTPDLLRYCFLSFEGASGRRSGVNS